MCLGPFNCSTNGSSLYKGQISSNSPVTNSLGRSKGFGNPLAARNSGRLILTTVRIRTVVSISLPLFRAASGFPKPFERPKLFVTGEFDEICPLYKLEPFVEQLKGPKHIKGIIGARHLMRGYEDAAVTTIVKYVKNWAEMPGV